MLPVILLCINVELALINTSSYNTVVRAKKQEVTMAENYDVSIKLVKNNKPCHSGHQVGDEWLWHDKTPAEMCFAAYNAILPFIQVLKFGGNFPWQNDPDIITVSCPDPEVVNVFEIKRTPEKKEKVQNYDVLIKLIGKNKDNPCSQGHIIGDEWIWSGRTPEKLCPSAYEAILSSVLVLKYGGQFPWQKDPDVLMATCPDTNVGNRFEIRRIPGK